jgi:hypothetical protein
MVIRIKGSSKSGEFGPFFIKKSFGQVEIRFFWSKFGENSPKSTALTLRG